MTEPDPNPGPKSSGSLLRDVAVIVLAGIALGVAHNAYLLGSGPRAGLAWIKEERRLAKLEDVLLETPEAAAATVPAGDAAATTEGATAAKPASEGAASTQKPVEKPAEKPAVKPGEPAPETKPASPPPPAGTTPAPASDAPATTPAPATDVPVIPVTREPLEAGLAVIRKLHAANAAVFVDARTANEYAEGHIPGAVHLSFDDVFKNPDLAKAFDDRGLPVVAYCGGGDCDLSRNLAFSLIDGGKKRVLVFLDGTAGWAAAGLPMTKGPQP